MSGKSFKSASADGFLPDGYCRLKAGLEEGVRRVVVAKYASDLEFAKSIRRALIRRKINREVAREVKRRLKNLISPGTLFFDAPSKESKPEGE